MSDLNLRNKNSDDSNPHGFKKEGRLDETRKKLYSTHYEPKVQRAKLNQKRYRLEDKWEGEEDAYIEKVDSTGDYWGPYSQVGEKAKEPTSKGFIFLLFSALIFFLGSLVYAYYVFNFRHQSRGESTVSLNILGPMTVGGGETFSFDVIMQNNHSRTLELVDLILEYPPGTRNPLDLSEETRRVRLPLADIEPGAMNRKNLSAVLFGDENSSQEVSATLEYRIQGSSAIFQRNARFSVNLSASPVRLAVMGLREISSGQEIELRANLSSNSNRELKDIMVTVDYPFGFNFLSSSIAPSFDNNVWIFPNLRPEDQKEIIIRGIVQGQQNDERNFRFNTGIRSEESVGQMGIVWNTTIHETRIEDGSGSLAFIFNGNVTNELVVRDSSEVTTVLAFYNNTDDTIRNIEIVVDLDGEPLNKRSIRVRQGGFYDSNTNTITWSIENSDRMRFLDAGDSLELEFTFSPIDFSQLEERIEQPIINLNARMSGVRVSGDRVQENIVARRPARISILSNIGASIFTAYGNNPLNNFGPVPPIVGQPTTYTLVLEVSNGNNALENVQFSTSLPSYVNWERVASPSGERVSYNENTRELIWNIGNLDPEVGINSDPRRLYLSVTFIPSLSQLNNSVNLTRNSSLRAFDSFARQNVNLNVDEATTRIFNRSTNDRHSIVRE